MNLIDWLSGKKTYIIAGLTAVYGVFVIGLADHQWSQVIPFLIASGAAGTFRAALAKYQAAHLEQLAAILSSVQQGVVATQGQIATLKNSSSSNSGT